MRVQIDRAGKNRIAQAAVWKGIRALILVLVPVRLRLLGRAEQLGGRKGEGQSGGERKRSLHGADYSRLRLNRKR